MPEIAHMLKRHGERPYTVAVIHGGPGGAGEVAPIAQELGARGYGVLEPIQTKRSIAAQVDELRLHLEMQVDGPVVLIGWSWGAWLSCLLTAEHPSLVSKLVLLGSGPFKSQDAAQTTRARHSRLTESEISELAAFFDNNATESPENLSRMFRLSDKADAYALVEHSDTPINFDREIYNSVWPEAAELRRSGKLLRIVGTIRCPVFAIHGDYDPHPAQGVEAPLSAAVPNFEFILLDKCGHKPWLERHARDKFFSELEKTIAVR